MNYSSIGILSLIVHVIIHFSVLLNKHYHKELPAAKAYRWMILSIGAFYIFDAIWGILYDAHLIRAVYIDTVFYFLAMAVSMFFWTRFVIRYQTRESNLAKIFSGIGWLMLITITVVLIVNFFTPVMFSFDEEGVYHAGGLRYMILIIQVLLFVSTAGYLLLTLKGTESKERLHRAAIGISSITVAVMDILQVLYPLQPFYSIGYLLGCCVIHTFVVNDMNDDRRIELEETLRREKQQEIELGSARHMAYTDSLTGVKNTHAYIEMVNGVDQQITNGAIKEFGVIVFDLNGLKTVNDTKGHEAGDEYIRESCQIICRQFKHSPVYRIGGDEFVAFLDGEDYRNRKILLASFETQIEENLRKGSAVVASGLAVFRPGHDNSYRRVFERADQRMYDRKGVLKTMEA